MKNFLFIFILLFTSLMFSQTAYERYDSLQSASDAERILILNYEYGLTNITFWENGVPSDAVAYIQTGSNNRRITTSRIVSTVYSDAEFEKEDGTIGVKTLAINQDTTTILIRKPAVNLLKISITGTNAKVYFKIEAIAWKQGG